MHFLSFGQKSMSYGVYCMNCNYQLPLCLDLGATLVCQSDPTWYKSDPKSTCTQNDLRRLGQKTTDFRLQVDFLHGTLLFIFVYYDTVVRSWVSIRVSVVIRYNFHLRVTSQICNLLTL